MANVIVGCFVQNHRNIVVVSLIARVILGQYYSTLNFVVHRICDRWAPEYHRRQVFVTMHEIQTVLTSTLAIRYTQMLQNWDLKNESTLIRIEFNKRKLNAIHDKRK